MHLSPAAPRHRPHRPHQLRSGPFRLPLVKQGPDGLVFEMEADRHPWISATVRQTT
ncbi:hypothetical protein DACRYDRAFT_20050 [Dacryopinax primogenitus]|uniref:Uncharacterized protein n=1 Tax=Dacryopinax primogenitus (strain DJM 731) TaxID=1858805 RepID=M5G9X0_DACPD|nr:uncharacterized protein DACRYDRAFT_20050 [Dacryopinax primogenitus]EJU05614.1 hypothetical protein DACRYDRAFT_20050 [Dacryopinax primogenitus]